MAKFAAPSAIPLPLPLLWRNRLVPRRSLDRDRKSGTTASLPRTKLTSSKSNWLTHVAEGSGDDEIPVHFLSLSLVSVSHL